MSVKIIFLGTGPSEGVPRLECVCRPHSFEGTAFSDKEDEIRSVEEYFASRNASMKAHILCNVCQRAVADPLCKNFRRNCSIVVQVKNENGGVFSLLVDCGKTFRDSALRFFPKFNISGIDSLLITHSHIDHVGGLDDFLTYFSSNHYRKSLITSKLANVESREDDDKGARLPTYAQRAVFKEVAPSYPWLFGLVEDHSKRKFVSNAIIANAIEDHQSSDGWFSISDLLHVLPIRVEHGKSCENCWGFRLSCSECNFAYIPDVNGISQDSMKLLTNDPKLDLLIIDAFIPFAGPVRTHFTLPEAIEIIEQVGAKKNIVTNLSHAWDYYDDYTTELLNTSSPDINIEMAFDGMFVELGQSERT